MFFVRLAQVVIAVAIVLTALWAAPKLDGLFNPVLVNFRFVAELDPEEPGATLVHGTFNRLRDCTFIRQDWYLGSPGKGVAITSVRLNQPAVLKADQLWHWGPTRLFLRPEQVLANVYAVSVHDCYGGWLWETETLAYNSHSKIMPE